MANTKEILNAFTTTKSANEIQSKIDSIQNKIAIESKKAKLEYHNKMKSIPRDISIPRFNSLSQAYNKEFYNKLDEIKSAYANELAELKKSFDKSFENFSVRIENNDAWNDIIHRKSVPQILSELTKADLTEEQLEININGELSDSAKKSRYGFPIKHLEELGWITRSGSGNPNDAKVSHITSEGIRQLDFYKKCKSFDCSNIIM